MPGGFEVRDSRSGSLIPDPQCLYGFKVSNGRAFRLSMLVIVMIVLGGYFILGYLDP